MPNYIRPEYEEFDNAVAAFVEEHQLDIVSVKSLIRGSIEIIEPEIPPASLVTLDIGEKKAYSAKPQNIKVNLKFAINTIFTFKPVFSEDGIWLILVILKVLIYLFSSISIQLDRKEALVLYALYRLRCGDENDIYSYLRKLKENGEDVDISQTDVRVAAEKLEKIRTIKMEDSKYILCEMIFVSKI